MNDGLETRTKLDSYGSSRASVLLRDFPENPFQPGRLAVEAYEFPAGQFVAGGYTDTIESFPDQGSERVVDVDITRGSIPTNTRVFYAVFQTADKSPGELQSGEATTLCHSDPFVFDGSQVRRSLPEYFPTDVSGEKYSRTKYEGSFDLSFSGTTDGREWSTGLYVFTDYYAQMREQPRGRDYDEYVAVAQQTGVADTFGQIFFDAATENGFESDRMKAEFVIDLIQNLPYVTDDVSRGFDEYPKFPAETLVDANGDCEDTSILLASVLQSESFNYDMVLLSPPGHMACGIYSSSLPGTYIEYDGRKYYYIETTGTGWGIGDLPDTYSDSEFTVYQV